MLAKAAGLPADEVVIDLEDSVVPEMKEEAGAGCGGAGLVGGTGGGGADQPAVSAWGAADVATLAGADMLVVPKVEDPDAGGGRRAARLVEGRPPSADRDGHRPAPRRGDRDRQPRVESLITGFADLAASLGHPVGADYPGDRWHHVRSTVLTAARAAGLQAIDGPHLEIADLEGLRVEAGYARALGFDGKWALHPSQIEPLNEVFSPTQDEVDRATAVLEALERAGADGAALLDGEMVDEASRKLAAQVVSRARAAGLTA